MEGFCWLARLAHWGVGACLADQMGLGETLQALAVILRNADKESTLIIAPTSVCMNWMSEAEKFAPTLNIIQFSGANRQKLFNYWVDILREILPESQIEEVESNSQKYQ